MCVWAEIVTMQLESGHLHEHVLSVFAQPDSPEHRAACKLWDLYLRTKNEFIQRGDCDEDEEEGYDGQDNPGGSTEDEVTPTHTNVNTDL